PLPAPLATKDSPRSSFGLPEDRFVFLFIFDFESHLERKNPLGLIEAFKRAFPHEGDVLLILKSSHANENMTAFNALTEASKGANVTIMDAVLSREEIN